MEVELMNLFEAAKKAAEISESKRGFATTAEISRCIDSLHQMKKGLPLTPEVLDSIKLATRLKHLTRHSSDKIRSAAASILDIWRQRNKRKYQRRRIFGKRYSKKPLPLPLECRDQSRDNIRRFLFEALSTIANEAEEENMREKLVACDARKAAVSLETEMYKKLGPLDGPKILKTLPMKMKYKSIMNRIEGAGESDLGIKLLLGEISPEKIVSLR